METNDTVGFETVPKECENYVEQYVSGDQYKKDSAVIIDLALRYARNLKLDGDGKDIWVFDIDETTLSNLPYYAKHGYGTEPRDTTSMKEWFEESDAPAVPASLKLYNELLRLEIKVAFLTGKSESLKDATEINLKKSGYTKWEKLILKGSESPSKL
ncbi:acid phosphatase 1-like [Pistacia vera]|uniref:acid phosphatase 1-like n=1 Tax=Pistacia vera TaxID=55513 RepID=UPI0012630FF3|nr:acid phosphatase 1-like [Pistacia vera]